MNLSTIIIQFRLFCYDFFAYNRGKKLLAPITDKNLISPLLVLAQVLYTLYTL